MTVKAGAGKCAEFTRMIRGSSSKRPEARRPAGEGAGGHEVGVRAAARRPDTALADVRGRHSLRQQPGTDPCRESPRRCSDCTRPAA